jgi:predicted ATP-dependent endonuclease of OLD family
MSNPRSILQTKFALEHCYANFGPVLMQMHVKGFRCHSNTLIEFASPITAFCGLNGTGKSTLLQLAAASYAAPASEWPRHYIRTFLDVGTLDPKPFTDDARVEYKFWQEDRSLSH